MPVLDPHRTDDHIAWPDDLNGLAPFLGEAESGRHDEDLSYGMDVPVGAAPGSKVTLPPLERMALFVG